MPGSPCNQFCHYNFLPNKATYDRVESNVPCSLALIIEYIISKHIHTIFVAYFPNEGLIVFKNICVLLTGIH